MARPPTREKLRIVTDPAVLKDRLKTAVHSAAEGIERWANRLKTIDDLAAHCAFHTRGRQELERAIHTAALGVHIALHGCPSPDYDLTGTPAYDELSGWNNGAGERSARGIGCLWHHGRLRWELHLQFAKILAWSYQLRQAATNIGMYGVPTAAEAQIFGEVPHPPARQGYAQERPTLPNCLVVMGLRNGRILKEVAEIQRHVYGWRSQRSMLSSAIAQAYRGDNMIPADPDFAARRAGAKTGQR